MVIVASSNHSTDYYRKSTRHTHVKRIQCKRQDDITWRADQRRVVKQQVRNDVQFEGIDKEEGEQRCSRTQREMGRRSEALVTCERVTSEELESSIDTIIRVLLHQSNTRLTHTTSSIVSRSSPSLTRSKSISLSHTVDFPEEFSSLHRMRLCPKLLEYTKSVQCLGFCLLKPILISEKCSL